MQNVSGQRGLRQQPLHQRILQQHRGVLNGVPAQDILSRGQLKVLVCAMRLAQGLYLNQHSSRGCIFLIDDFASELDVDKRRLLAARLKQCASQVFITAIDTGQLADMMDASDCKLFHVEQGKISETLEKAESKL